MIRLLMVVMGIIAFSPLLPAQALRVQITGIRSAEGVVRVSFFGNSHEFDKEKPRYEKVVSKSGMKNGKITLLLADMPPGRYGIAVLDDENANGKMDYRWLKPAEGYGFSDLVPAKMRRPGWEEFQFDYSGLDKTVTVALIFW